jgi:hypothetical protein
MVPRSDVSLLLRRVTGNPEVKRAMPETAQPEAMAWIRPSHFGAGSAYWKLPTKLWRRSNAERARLSEGLTGLTGSGRPLDWSIDLEYV